jgi:hypothetical protein
MFYFSNSTGSVNNPSTPSSGTVSPPPPPPPPPAAPTSAHERGVGAVHGQNHSVFFGGQLASRPVHAPEQLVGIAVLEDFAPSFDVKWALSPASLRAASAFIIISGRDPFVLSIT